MRETPTTHTSGGDEVEGGAREPERLPHPSSVIQLLRAVVTALPLLGSQNLPLKAEETNLRESVTTERAQGDADTRETAVLLASRAALDLWLEQHKDDPRWQGWLEGGQVKNSVVKAWREFAERFRAFPTPAQLRDFINHLTAGNPADTFFERSQSFDRQNTVLDTIQDPNLRAFYSQRMPDTVIESQKRAERNARIARIILQAMKEVRDREEDDPLANYIVLGNDREVLIQDLEWLFRRDFEGAGLRTEDLHAFVQDVVRQWRDVQDAAAQAGVAVTKRFIVEFLQAKDEGRRGE